MNNISKFLLFFWALCGSALAEPTRVMPVFINLTYFYTLGPHRVNVSTIKTYHELYPPDENGVKQTLVEFVDGTEITVKESVDDIDLMIFEEYSKPSPSPKKKARLK